MSFKVATISLCSTEDCSKNMDQVRFWLAKAVDAGAKWLVLPEVFYYYGGSEGHWQNAVGAQETSSLLRELQSFCAEHAVTLFCGSVGARKAGESRRVFNRMWVISQLGELITSYDKTHLFQLNSADGRPLYQETETFLFGDRIGHCVVDGLRVGLAVCYDLRFSEYFRRVEAEYGPPDVWVIPAAFTFETGKAHWQILLQARAIEGLAYVLASNQTGEHLPGKRSYGNSMVVDPWGTVLSATGSEPGIALADMDLDKVKEARERLPVFSNKRPELYGKR